MSKYKVKDIWNERYGKNEEIVDYAGRVMKKSACGNRNSRYEPTIDHVRPLSKGGRDVKENLVICHWETNAEKGDKFPHWQANGKRLKAIKVKGSTNGYEVVDDLQKEKNDDKQNEKIFTKHKHQTVLCAVAPWLCAGCVHHDSCVLSRPTAR